MSTDAVYVTNTLRLEMAVSETQECSVHGDWQRMGIVLNRVMKMMKQRKRPRNQLQSQHMRGFRSKLLTICWCHELDPSIDISMFESQLYCLICNECRCYGRWPILYMYLLKDSKHAKYDRLFQHLSNVSWWNAGGSKNIANLSIQRTTTWCNNKTSCKERDPRLQHYISSGKVLCFISHISGGNHFLSLCTPWFSGTCYRGRDWFWKDNSDPAVPSWGRIQQSREGQCPCVCCLGQRGNNIRSPYFLFLLIIVSTSIMWGGIKNLSIHGNFADWLHPASKSCSNECCSTCRSRNGC